MTQYALTGTGSGLTANLDVLQRKVQGNVLFGFSRKCEEWGKIQKLKDFDMDASAREVTAPIDILRQPSGAFIPEFGYEAIPRTEEPKEVTFTWANYNDRFTYSLTSQYLDRKYKTGALIRQAKFQTLKLIEGLTRRVSFSYYGTTDGVLALTSTVQTATSGTYALIDAFGQSELDDTTYLSSLFVADDYVALVRSSTLVSNALGGQVISNSGGNMVVVWPGSVISAANDKFVLANSTGWQAITGTIAHTDFNQAPVGLLNMLKTTSVHGLSGSTYPLWAAAKADTAGSNLTGTRIKAMQHAITNLGGGTPNMLTISQGVERNLLQTTSASVEFNDPLNMQIIGSVKTGGITPFSSQRVPAGYAILEDTSTRYKWTLAQMPGEEAASIEGLDNANQDKLQDQNGYVQSFDFPFGFCTKNRGNMAYANSLTES